MAYWVYRPEPQPVQRVPRVPPSALITGSQPPRRTNAQLYNLVGRWWPEDKYPHPAQLRRNFVAPQTLAYGNQPPRKTNAQLQSIVNQQWPLDKEPYPYQLWRAKVVPPTFVPVTDNPPPYSIVRLMGIVGQWPQDKEPALNPRMAEDNIVTNTLTYGSQPPPISEVNYGTIITSWQLAAPPLAVKNQNVAWNTQAPAVSAPPPNKSAQNISIINAWSQDKWPYQNQFWIFKVAPFYVPPVVNQPPRKTNAQYADLISRHWPADKEPRLELFRRVPAVFPGLPPPVVIPDRLSQAIKEAYASAPAGVIDIHTLEFRHPNFLDEFNVPAPIRVVLGHQILQAKLEDDAPQNPGQYVTFIPMAFDLELPNVEHLAMPEIGISIDNVSRVIEDNLSIAAASPYPIEVTYRPYLNTDLSQPQMNPPLTMTLTSAEADDFKVNARATYGNAANVLVPRQVYNTERFPGIQR